MPKARGTIAFIGSGAVQGSWKPVIQALKTSAFPDVSSIDGANFSMARLVYIGRQTCRWGKGEQRILRKEFRKKLQEVTNAISAALDDAVARGDLFVRPEFQQVLREVVVRDTDRVAVVTTNWESTVERAVRSIESTIPVRYLHGSCKQREDIYLPTEIVEEPYRKKRVRDLLSDQRADVIKGVGQATKLVLYGLALSPLDAELGQILASAMHGSNVEVIHVVDPRYPLVAERVAGLVDATGERVANVVGSCPTDLARVWRFTPEGFHDECRRLGLRP